MGGCLLQTYQAQCVTPITHAPDSFSMAELNTLDCSLNELSKDEEVTLVLRVVGL